MTTKRLYKIILLLALVCLLIAWAAMVVWNGGPPYFHFAQITARVIDAETKEPIEGAIVTANWELVAATFMHTRIEGQMAVKETTTDHDGRFYFPTIIRPNVFGYEIRTADPHLVIFKPGYRVIFWANPDFMASFNRNPHRTSPVDGQTLKLKRFAGSKEQYAEELQRLGSGLRFATDGNGCEWWNIPRMIIAADQLESEYRQLGIRVGLNSIENLKHDRCGFPTELFAPYMKP